MPTQPGRYQSSIQYFITLVLLLGLAAEAAAQVAPGVGYVYPPAVPIGETTEVRMGGFDWTPDLQWFVHADGVELTEISDVGDYHIPPPPYWFGPRASASALPIPREVSGRIKLAPTQPEGLVYWQVANANGASTTAVFYASRQPEIVESRSRNFPQRLPSLPVAVSGRLSRLEEVDRYELVADRDGIVTVELMARRLGADFNGVVQVRDPAGRLIAELADTEGVDGQLSFAAESGACYVVSLHDADFRGDRSYVYRLAFRHEPRIVCTLPAMGKRGATEEVQFVGVGIASGKAILETVTDTIRFPSDTTARSHIHSLKSAAGVCQVEIPLGDNVELVDDVADAALGRQIPGPAAITGWMPEDVDERRMSWEVNKDEHWSVNLQSRGVGGKADVALEVLGPDGKPIAENDDLAGTSDAALQFRAATTGLHTAVVRRMSAPTDLDVYRLQVARSVPGFALVVPQQVSLALGGSVAVAVQAERTGGFEGAISVSVDGLPEGVTTEGEWVIPAGKSEAKLSLSAAADAPVVASVLRLQGSADIGGSNITRAALATAAGNLCPRLPREQQIPQVLLAMTMPAPFDILVVDRERQRDVHRGTTYLAEIDIVRHDGFRGEVQIAMSARQSRYRQGISGGVVTVPSNETRALYPCFMPEWLSTDLTRRMIVHGIVAVPDPHGKTRYLTKGTDARITMIMEGALLKLAADTKRIDVAMGDSFNVPVQVSRSAKFPLPVTVELEVPEEAAGLFRADPVSLLPGEDSGTVRIQTMRNGQLEGPWTIRLRAIALKDGKWPVVSEAEVPVVVSRGTD